MKILKILNPDLGQDGIGAMFYNHMGVEPEELVVYEGSTAHKFFTNGFGKGIGLKLTLLDDSYKEKEDNKENDKLSPQTNDNITFVTVLCFIVSFGVIIFSLSKRRKSKKV